jgi:hypothetical protein
MVPDAVDTERRGWSCSTRQLPSARRPDTRLNRLSARRTHAGAEMTRTWPIAPADLMFCLPTLYPDLGDGTDTHLEASLSAATGASWRP